MCLDVEMLVEVDRQIPDAESDGTSKTMRAGRYGEPYVQVMQPNMYADEGTYQIATSPTPGTGIAFAVNAGVSETAGNFIHVKNNEAADNSRGQRMYLHYLRLICTAVPAAGVSLHYFFKVDNVNRYTSGGTALSATNGNIGMGTGSISQINVGALTTGAPSQASRLLSRGVLRSVIPVVNDEFIFNFGCQDMPGTVQLGGLVAQRMVIPCPPVILSPSTNLCLQLWSPSNAVTPASFEVEMGWWER